MSKLACTFLLFSLLHALVPTGAFAKGKSPKGPATPPSRFSGPTVLVKYVAGTQGQDGLGQMGCLSLGSDASNLFFFAYPRRAFPVRATGFLVHLVDPSWVKGGTPCAKALVGTKGPCLPIPLDKDHVKGLARGQVQTMGQAGAGALQALGTLSGTGGAVAALTGKLSTGAIWGAAVGGTIALASTAVYLNRRTQNYIAIFYNEATPTEPELTTQSKVITRKFSKSEGKAPSKDVTVVTTKAASAASLFPKCTDFAVFQIVDPHDYWNTSMFLNAMTGLTFVDQSATQGGKGAAGGSTPSGNK